MIKNNNLRRKSVSIMKDILDNELAEMELELEDLNKKRKERNGKKALKMFMTIKDQLSEIKQQKLLISKDCKKIVDKDNKYMCIFIDDIPNHIMLMGDSITHLVMIDGQTLRKVRKVET